MSEVKQTEVLDIRLSKGGLTELQWNTLEVVLEDGVAISIRINEFLNAKEVGASLRLLSDRLETL